MSESITYEEFSAMDIRIGVIRAVERVPDTDKLLKLTVDFGEEERTIVSGIAEYFEDQQSLVGKHLPFIINLEPRVIRGVESQGMILAVGSGDEFSLLECSDVIAPGSRVK